MALFLLQQWNRAIFFLLFNYTQALSIPQATARIPIGTSSKIPPANSKQPARTGIARISKTTAATFANPQVILKVSLTAWKNSHTNNASVNNSNIFNQEHKTISRSQTSIRKPRHLANMMNPTINACIQTKWLTLFYQSFNRIFPGYCRKYLNTL